MHLIEVLIIYRNDMLVLMHISQDVVIWIIYQDNSNLLFWKIFDTQLMPFLGIQENQ